MHRSRVARKSTPRSFVNDMIYAGARATPVNQAPRPVNNMPRSINSLEHSRLQILPVIKGLRRLQDIWIGDCSIHLAWKILKTISGCAYVDDEIFRQAGKPSSEQHYILLAST